MSLKLFYGEPAAKIAEPERLGSGRGEGCVDLLLEPLELSVCSGERRPKLLTKGLVQVFVQVFHCEIQSTKQLIFSLSVRAGRGERSPGVWGITFAGVQPLVAGLTTTGRDYVENMAARRDC